MGKKNEVINCVPKKKSFGKKVVKVVLIAAAVQGAYQCYKKWKQKCSNEELEIGEKAYDLFMNGKQLRLDEEYIKKIKLKASLSGIDLDLRYTDLAHEVWIECNLLMSGLNIKVPENVNVDVDLKCPAGGVSNTVPTYMEEDFPTIHIIGKSIMSGVSVRVVETQEDEFDDADFDDDSMKEEETSETDDEEKTEDKKETENNKETEASETAEQK